MPQDDSPWPFDQPRNTAAFSLRSIVFDGEPILYVVHEAEDGSWQFLDGKPLEMANAALVGLGTIVSQDASVLEVADLPLGWSAFRSSVNSAWRRSPAEA